MNRRLPVWANRSLSAAYLFTLALYSDPIISGHAKLDVTMGNSLLDGRLDFTQAAPDNWTI